MRRIFVAMAASVLFLAFAAPSQATDACYTWDCDEATRTCTFDASCSTWTGLWRYRWDFGDGSGLVLTGNPSIQHTFSGNYSTVELMVIPYSTDPDAVSCEVIVKNNVSPPLPTSGTCD